MKEEKTIVIDVRLTREFVVALVAVLAMLMLLVYPALAGRRAEASGDGTAEDASLASSSGMRQFYLTETKFLGNQTLTACAAGYHFASLWEIAEPSNLRYNPALGYTRSDSGQGPPAGAWGWVRTGYVSGGSDMGQANCNSWTSASGLLRGTYAQLPTLWTGGYEDLGVWSFGTDMCSGDEYAWCIED
jgi:hypothetical protein